MNLLEENNNLADEFNERFKYYLRVFAQACDGFICIRPLSRNPDKRKFWWTQIRSFSAN